MEEIKRNHSFIAEIGILILFPLFKIILFYLRQMSQLSFNYSERTIKRAFFQLIVFLNEHMIKSNVFSRDITH